MDIDKKEMWQRYSGLTTEDLIKLQRSARLSSADAVIVDEILEFRGISKTVRENLKNSSVNTQSISVGSIDTTSKEIASRPVLVTLIALFALWQFISNILSVFDSKTFLSIVYFLSLAVLSIYLAYGLWDLKPWARKFMIFYCGLVISLSWLLILLLYLFADSNWRLSLEELVRSEPKLSGREIAKVIKYKVLFIKACTWSVVYGLLMSYFFKADIRRLFR